MKDLNKILYDILIKIEKVDQADIFNINSSLVLEYFKELKNEKSNNYMLFASYFSNFYDFCFELSLENMLNNSINFKN